MRIFAILTRRLRAAAMHLDSVESGSNLPAVLHAALLVLLSAAFQGCVSEKVGEPPPEPELAEVPADVEAVQSEPSAEAESPGVDPAAQEQEAEPAEEEERWPEPNRASQESITESAPDTEPSSEERGSEIATESSSADPGLLHGSLSMRYRGRTNGDDRDHEIGGVLALDLFDENVPWIAGHLQARVDLDLEGKDDDEAFGDLSDTYDDSVITKLYLAYADLALDADPEQSPGTLRIGRQSDPRLPEVLRLDGVSYLTRPMGEREIEVGAYGGIPVHLYESSHEGDRAFGTFVEGIPWRDGRARLDWMHLEDELVLGDQRDDLLNLSLWHDLEHWRLEGEYTHLEGDPRDLRLRALFDNPSTDTIVRAGYFELLETQRAHVTELDPFFQELLEYFPYRQTTLNLSQGIGERTIADLGFDLRRVSDSDDVGEFNRDWERYYLTMTWNDLVREGVGLGVTVDRWDDDDRDTSTLGADLSYAPEKRWEAGIGSYYSLYKYEFLELDERDDVRTYYTRASYEVSERLDLELLYEFENDDLDTYHTLRLEARWRF